MQVVGKRVGPNRGWVITTIIAYAIFFVTLPVQMILYILSQIYILYQFLTRVMMKCDMTYVNYGDSFFKDILMWTHYLILPLYQLLLTICTELIYDVTIAPIYFWKICWHPKVRSIWQIFGDPEGGAVRIDTTVNTDGTESERTRHIARP